MKNKKRKQSHKEKEDPVSITPRRIRPNAATGLCAQSFPDTRHGAAVNRQVGKKTAD